MGDGLIVGEAKRSDTFEFCRKQSFYAILVALTLTISFLIHDFLEYFTSINMDNILLNIVTFVVIYVLVYLMTKMLTSKYR